MNFWQDRVLSVSIIVADASWIYLALGLTGKLFGFSGSILSAISLLFVSGTSFIINRHLQQTKHEPWVAAIYQGLFALTIISIVTLTQLTNPLGPSNDSIFLREHWWFKSFLVIVTGFLVWWRSMRLAYTTTSEETLYWLFKIGLAVISLAAIFEVSFHLDLPVLVMTFTFFSASLGGLFLINLEKNSIHPDGLKWPRVAGASISVVLLAGGIVTFISSTGISEGISTIFGFTWNLIAMVIYALIMLVGLLAGIIFTVVHRFIGNLLRENEGNYPEIPDLNVAERLREGLQGQENLLPHTVSTSLELISIAFVIIVLTYLVMRAYRSWPRDIDDSSETRESLWDEASPGRDISNLLLGLFPGLLKSRKHRNQEVEFPEGPLGTLFRLYHLFLIAASVSGVPRNPSETPLEFKERVQHWFPKSFLFTLTKLFNRARYGNRIPDENEIDPLMTEWIDWQQNKNQPY